ncbi:MAG TPA: hypothetical protein VF128_13655 [Gemmatimonadaceae bacterium]
MHSPGAALRISALEALHGDHIRTGEPAARFVAVLAPADRLHCITRSTAGLRRVKCVALHPGRPFPVRQSILSRHTNTVLASGRDGPDERQTQKRNTSG